MQSLLSSDGVSHSARSDASPAKTGPCTYHGRRRLWQIPYADLRHACLSRVLEVSHFLGLPNLGSSNLEASASDCGTCENLLTWLGIGL